MAHRELGRQLPVVDLNGLMCTKRVCPPAIGNVIGGIFGTNRPRGQRLSTGQLIAREVTRSVTTRVAGQVVGGLGKSLGGSVGNSIGRAIVRGTLGGILRR